jgi:DnaJ-class molecular chaperone
MVRTVVRAVLLLGLAVCNARSRTLYDTLGVKREEATPASIKKAYKRMALKCHPDRQVNADAATRAKAEAEFKKAAHAYEVLSDPDKRKVYDSYGEEGLQAKEQGADFASSPFVRAAHRHGGPGSVGGMSDGAYSFGSSPFGGGGGMRFGGASFGKGGGVRFSVNGADLFEALFSSMGGMASSGMGGEPSSAFGRGRSRSAGRTAAPPRAVEVTCSLAQVYSGHEKKLRVRLRGESTVVSLHVPPGCRPGTKLLASGAAGATAGLSFVLKVAPHPWLERDGDDLVWRCTLTRAQARAKKGVRLRIRTLDGRELVVSTRGSKVRDGTRHRVRGEGMPEPGGVRGRKGDLIIVFAVTGR